MQAQLAKFSERVVKWLAKLAEITGRLVLRGVEQLQKLWAWYRGIEWPEIPLTPLQWVLLFYAVFGILFLVATPIFEASDERWHFGMVEHLVENNFELPVQDPDAPETIYRQEGSQPPLYYLASALIVLPIDLDDSAAYRIENPHAQAGNPQSWGNKNMFIHEGVELRGTPLAVYLLRALGLVMGAVTVWAVYQCGKIAAPHRPPVAILAAVLTAFNPMFLFISASVNNDTLIIMLNSLAIWLGLLTMRDGFETRRSLLLALLIALAALTKLSALVLVPVVALGALWVAQRDKDWRGLLILGTAMFVFWAVIAGWWYLRNIQLYGELFGTATMAAVAGPRESFSLATALSEFQGFRLSYWGVFGAFNIVTSGFFYALMDFAVFTAVFGVIFLVAQLVSIRDFSYARRELTSILFLLGILLVGMVAFLSWTSQTFASQGRLLFPFMGAISPLLAIGFAEVVWWLLFLLSPPDRSFIRAEEAVPERTLRETLNWPLRFMGLFALLIPLATIAPEYRPPAPIETVAEEDFTSVYARYGDIELIGYDFTDRRYFPGERVRVTLYWRVIEPSEEDYSLGLVLVDPEGNPLGSIDTYPGAGTLRTSTWEEGAIYADTYELTIGRVAEARYPLRLLLNWYDEEPQNRLEIVSRDDANLESVLLNVGALVTASPSAGSLISGVSLSDVDVAQREFQGTLRLISFLPTPEFVIDVQWETVLTPEADYTAFMHVLNEDGDLVGQSDVFPPLPTHYWRFGERFVITHAVRFFEDPLPEGEYRVDVGWYLNNDEDFPRLLIQPNTEEQKNAYTLFNFTVNDVGEVVLPEFEIDELTEEPGLETIPEPDVTVPVPSAEETAEATAEE